MFLDTVVCKGTRFNEKAILDVKTHFKQTENLPAHTFRPLSTDLSNEKPLTLGNVWEKYFKFQKNALWTEATNTIWKKNCYQE